MEINRRELLLGLLAMGGQAGLARPAGAQGSTPPRPYRIDVHHHFAPPAWVTAVKGRPLLQPANTTWTPAKSIEDMDRGGVAAAMVSITNPGLWFGDAPMTRSLARACNDYGATLVRDHPSRFGLFAAMPLPDVDGALREIEYALRQSDCRLLLAATSYKTSDYAAMIDAVRANVPALERVVFLGTDSWKELLATSVVADRAAVYEREALLQFDDPINIQYTSGTTGFPKGATLSHHNILNNGYFIGEGCRYTSSDRVCIPVPFYHCFGMVLGNLACTTHGAAIVVPAPTFDAAATLRAVQEERCTSLYGVPTMFIAELALPDFSQYDLLSLRTGIMAGSPCSTAHLYS